MKVILTVVLFLLILTGILLEAAAQALPSRELQRRAKSGKDKHAGAIYKMAAYNQSLKIFLLLVGILSSAGLIFGLVKSNWELALLLLATLSWAVFIDRVLHRGRGLAWRLAANIAPAVSWTLDYLQPVLGWLAKGFKSGPSHSGVYEGQDLLELLNQQADQVDNRITEVELKVARGALTFGDKNVVSVMTPAKDVAWVDRDDPISPKLMDDLHKTGFTRFPVINGSATHQTVHGSTELTNPAPTKSRGPDQSVGEVVGTLYLADLLKNLEKPGAVGDIMQRSAHFINESHMLEQALDGFLKSGHYLLVVVNNFEEVVGVLTLEDVLSQILGQKINDEFDRYHDKHAVAGHEPK